MLVFQGTCKRPKATWGRAAAAAEQSMSVAKKNISQLHLFPEDRNLWISAMNFCVYLILRCVTDYLICVALR